MSMDVTDFVDLQVPDECMDCAPTNSDREKGDMIACQEVISESATVAEQAHDPYQIDELMEDLLSWNSAPAVALELTVASEETTSDREEDSTQSQEDVMEPGSMLSEQLQEKVCLADINEVLLESCSNVEEMDCVPGTSSDADRIGINIRSKKSARRRSMFADIGIESPPEYLNIERRKSSRVTKQTSIFDESLVVPTKRRERARKIEYVFEHDSSSATLKPAMKLSSMSAGHSKKVDYSPLSTVYVVPHLEGWSNDTIRMPEDTREAAGLRLSSANLQLTPTSRKRVEDNVDGTEELYFNLNAVFGDEREKPVTSNHSFEELFCGRNAVVRSSCDPSPASIPSPTKKPAKKNGRRRSKAAHLSSVEKLALSDARAEKTCSTVQPCLQDVENVDPTHSPNGKKMDVR